MKYNLNLKISNCQFRLFISVLTVAFAIFVVTGCASISPAPFTALTASTKQLRDGADTSLRLVHERARHRYIIETAASSDSAKIESLLLTQPDGKPFDWESADPPLFLKAARFQEGVYRLNSILVAYTGLLEQLASPALVNPETFERLAKDLNGNLKIAIRALGASPPPNKEIAIFSTLATAAFRAYLQNKQRSSLLTAINDNQATIQNVSELGASAARLTMAALRNEYDLASKKLAELISESTRSKSAKETAIKELVELDDKFIKEIAIMRALHQSYTTLPSAHQELAAGLRDPKCGLPMIHELLENSRELYRLYEELSKGDKKKDK